MRRAFVQWGADSIRHVIVRDHDARREAEGFLIRKHVPPMNRMGVGMWKITKTWGEYSPWPRYWRNKTYVGGLIN